MKPIEPRTYPPPIAEEVVQRFSSREIEDIAAFLIWHEQKLRARRHRDGRCVECGHRRIGAKTNPQNLRCPTCQAFRRERLKKLRVSVYLEEPNGQA